MRQANRHFARPGLVTLDDLTTITAEDVRASRVFSQDAAKPE